MNNNWSVHKMKRNEYEIKCTSLFCKHQHTLAYLSCVTYNANLLSLGLHPSTACNIFIMKRCIFHARCHSFLVASGLVGFTPTANAASAGDKTVELLTVPYELPRILLFDGDDLKRRCKIDLRVVSVWLLILLLFMRGRPSSVVAEEEIIACSDIGGVEVVIGGVNAWLVDATNEITANATRNNLIFLLMCGCAQNISSVIDVLDRF